TPIALWRVLASDAASRVVVNKIRNRCLLLGANHHPPQPLLAQSGHPEACTPMSAFGGKADIAPASALCPLLTQSGHWPHRNSALQGAPARPAGMGYAVIHPWRGPQMHFDRLKRREFITLLGGAAWPLAARAQQRERMRRVGVLLPATADDAGY